VPIDISCPECGKEYYLADTQLGKKVECRGCKGKFLVEDKEDDRRRKSRKDDDDDRPRKSRKDDEDDRDPDRKSSRDKGRDEEGDRKPRDKARPGKSNMLLWGLIGGGGGLVLLVGVVIVLVVTLGGNKVTKENYDKLNKDMTEQQVLAIMGKPTREDADGGLNDMGMFGGKKPAKGKGMTVKAMVWESGKNQIQVTWLGDKIWVISGTFDEGGGRQSVHMK